MVVAFFLLMEIAVFFAVFVIAGLIATQMMGVREALDEHRGPCVCVLGGEVAAQVRHPRYDHEDGRNEDERDDLRP